MSFDAVSALERSLRTLRPVLDVLEGRVASSAPPPWCALRGWGDFLLALNDEELRRCEAEGLAARVGQLSGAPLELVELANGVLESTRWPVLDLDPRAPPLAALRAVPARKRHQLAALLVAVEPMASQAARLVDVGAGSGHFTRLAAARFEREAVGLERDRHRVGAASARALEDARRGAPGSARFTLLDACREPLALTPDDLAVGLHACGELGDWLVAAVVEARCDLVLVSCCLQKIGGEVRLPLSVAAEGLILRRESLGLTNLTAQPVGVERSLEATMRARQARDGLLHLLRARGVDVAPGDEMRGLNRRRAHAGLDDLARRALALRALPAPTPEELRLHEHASAARHASIRRLSLPRSMLARLLEVTVVLDRAAALQEAGAHVQVAALFDAAVTPRNLGLFASHDASRLPSARPKG